MTSMLCHKLHRSLLLFVFSAKFIGMAGAIHAPASQRRRKIDKGEPAKTHEKGKHRQEKHRKDQQIRQQQEARRQQGRRECPDLARDVVVDVEMAAACPSVPPAHCSARPSPPTTTAQAQSHGHRLLKKQLLQTGKKIVWLVCLLIACFCATPKPENRTR